MKKIWIAIVSMLLLLALGASVAFADVNPNQMGAQGGANIPGVTNQIPPQLSAPVVESSSDDYGSYLPSGNEDVPSSYYAPAGDPYTSLPLDWVEEAQPDMPQIMDNPQASGYVEGGAFMPYGEVSGSTASTPAASGGTQKLDWIGVGYDLINKNKSITIYDIKAGFSWGATYINGKNHADVIPASQADAQKLINNKIGGPNDYVRRPVLVTIAGTQFAGSMYVVGHGETNYCDYYNGVMCIHFSGSKTHGTQKVDADHQNAVEEAFQYGN